MITQQQIDEKLLEFKLLIQYTPADDPSLVQALNVARILAVIGCLLYASTTDKDDHLGQLLCLLISAFLASTIMNAMSDGRKKIISLYKELQKQVEDASTPELKAACHIRLEGIINALYQLISQPLLMHLMNRGIYRNDRSETLKIISTNIHAYFLPIISDLTTTNIQSQFQCDLDAANEFIRSYRTLTSEMVATKVAAIESLDAVLNAMVNIVEQDWQAKADAAPRAPGFR